MREEMRGELTDFIFHVWIEPLRPAGQVGDTLFIAAPGHVRGWVRERYGGLLRRTQTGHVQNYALGIAVGLIVMAASYLLLAAR